MHNFCIYCYNIIYLFLIILTHIIQLISHSSLGHLGFKAFYVSPKLARRKILCAVLILRMRTRRDRHSECHPRHSFTFECPPDTPRCGYSASRSLVGEDYLPMATFIRADTAEDSLMLHFFNGSSYITSINSYQICHSLSSNVSILFYQVNNFLLRFL